MRRVPTAAESEMANESMALRPLAERVAIVTGSTSGIGLDIAMALAPPWRRPRR